MIKKYSDSNMSSPSSSDRDVLWRPSAQFEEAANITRFIGWLKNEHNISVGDYQGLWNWSVTNIEDFWRSIWHFFDIKASKPFSRPLSTRKMPGAKWFVGSELNYAEQVFRNTDELGDMPAMIFTSEARPEPEAISWKKLRDDVSALSNSMKQLGVGRGDRVVACLPNIPETVVAFLASASLGAIWSSCSPDFGVASVVDRFKQIEPKLLFAVDKYSYNGKVFDRHEAVYQIRSVLPTLEHTVMVSRDEGSERAAPADRAGICSYRELLVRGNQSGLNFVPVPFDHPLWVLYSSGTTGLPKPIVHGHGGIVLEHLKTLSLHTNLKRGDRFFWFTTTGWMMWNFLVGGLLLGTTIVLYDGSPSYPDLQTLWKIVQDQRVTYFGTSAPFIMACAKDSLAPGKMFELQTLAGIGSTAAPLSTDGFEWVYRNVKQDVWLGSISGGTDICTALVGSCPTLPVYAGQIQCKCLGVKVEAYNELAQPVLDEVGELVVTEPMPSMPIYLWGDPENKRYLETYFEMYPGVWRHGDWIRLTPNGGCLIYGRSDATIKRSGIRIGTGDIYKVVESMDEVADSLAVDLTWLGGRSAMLLFVVPRKNVVFDDSLKQKIKERIRLNVSPRHLPDEIYRVNEIPRTLNDKKLEVPVRRILMGVPLEKAVNLGSVKNPESLKFFVQFSHSKTA